MTTRYVGPGGNDGNNGTSWATRKATLTGVEDTPVVAGDTVYVGPGTYREQLTCDVSGTAGNVITYIGDYTGANTDGVGGIVRITGLDADSGAFARDKQVLADTKNYRTFRGFTFDGCNGNFNLQLTNVQNWTIDECAIYSGVSGGCIYLAGASQLAVTVSNCHLVPAANGYGVYSTHSATVDNAGHTITSCIIGGGAGASSHGVYIIRVGGITVNNCLIYGAAYGVRVGTALSGGPPQQVVTVNNCVLTRCGTALQATTVNEFTENYNALSLNGIARSNVNTGANSNAYTWLPDDRWFHEATNGGRLLTPFDMASYCALVNVAGTSPPAADLRGTTVQGAQREWGALEYDSTLLIESAGGGMLAGNKRFNKQG